MLATSRSSCWPISTTADFTLCNDFCCIASGRVKISFTVDPSFLHIVQLCDAMKHKSKLSRKHTCNGAVKHELHVKQSCAFLCNCGRLVLVNACGHCVISCHQAHTEQRLVDPSALQSLKLGLSGAQVVAVALPQLTALDMNNCTEIRHLELRCPSLLTAHFQNCR